MQQVASQLLSSKSQLIKQLAALDNVELKVDTGQGKETHQEGGEPDSSQVDRGVSVSVR